MVGGIPYLRWDQLLRSALGYRNTKRRNHLGPYHVRRAIVVNLLGPHVVMLAATHDVVALGN